MKKLYLIIISSFILLYADSQSLDPSFNGKGFTTIGFLKDNINNEANGQVLPQSDRSFIVLFQFNGFAMYGRYSSDGELDKSFGKEGFSEPLAIVDARGALQSNGKIVIAGLVFNSPQTEFDFSLARYNVDGTLDKTFGVNGYQTTDFFNGDDIAFDIAVQPNDKILVAGLAENPATDNSDFALARYTPNGSPDNSFSGDGKQTTDFNGSSEQVIALAIQSNGKIVATGFSYNESSGFYNIATARYTSAGTLDNTFDGDGKKITSVSAGDNYANGVAIQADGKIVIAGKSYDGANENSKISVIRYNVSGSLDNSFSGDGKLLVDFEGVNAGRAVTIQPDGKILVGGYKYDPKADARDFAVLRFNSNGTPDDSFNKDGVVTTDFYGGNDVAVEISILPDGKILASGEVMNSNDNLDFAVVKYNSDGKTDKHFGKKGLVTGYVNTSDGRISAIAIQTDGKIVAGGSTYTNNTLSDFALARFNTDGTLDNSFGENGKVITDFSGDYDDISALAIQPDGKIVAAGSANNSKTNVTEFGLARYNPDGSLDRQFGKKGKQTIAVLPEYNIANALALQPDGKIIIAGYTFNAQKNNFDIGIARFTSDGSPDNTFDGDGKRATDLSNSDDFVCGVAVQGDGKIVLAGYTFPQSGTSDFAAVRYNSNGSYDNSFDGDGKAIFDLGSDEYATGFQLQKDGKLVIGGQIYDPALNTFDFVVARFNSNGTPDNSFDGDGKQVTDYGHEDNYAAALSIQPDGKILLAGSVSNSNLRMFNLQLTRYNSNGSLDKTFDGDGILVDDYLHYDNNVTSLTFYNNKIYVGGYSFLPEQNGVLTRYLAGSSLPVTKSLQRNVVTEKSELIVKAHPNPSTQYFTLSLNGGENNPASVKVSDAGGRLIEVKSNITPNASLLIGAKYKPGIYYVEITQGSSRKLLQLVKQ